MVDMVDEIAWGQSEVLNAKGGGSKLGNALKQGLRDQELMLLESDADEQLLITIAFNSKVKLQSIAIAGPADGRAPKNVKLFVNAMSLSFDDAESGAPAQELEFTPEMLGERTELKFVKFQNVDRLTVFVGSNQDDGDETALSSLQLWGCQVATTNMGEFKRVAGEKGEGE